MAKRKPRPVAAKRIDKVDALVDEAVAAIIDGVRLAQGSMMRLNDVRWKLDTVRRESATPAKRRKGR